MRFQHLLAYKNYTTKLAKSIQKEMLDKQTPTEQLNDKCISRALNECDGGKTERRCTRSKQRRTDDACTASWRQRDLLSVQM